MGDANQYIAVDSACVSNFFCERNVNYISGLGLAALFTSCAVLHSLPVEVDQYGTYGKNERG